jgi:hypothetical protein
MLVVKSAAVVVLHMIMFVDAHDFGPLRPIKKASKMGLCMNYCG